MNQQRSHRFSKFSATLLSAAVLTLAGCGGGGGGDKSPAPTPPEAGVQQGTVTTYVTDNLTLDYAKVWVGIRSIALVDDNGVRTTVYTPENGASSTLINLSELVNVGALLSKATVPMTNYVKAVVVLDDAVTLEPAASGALIQATFGGSGQPAQFEVPVSLNVEGNASLVLDFDLARFAYMSGPNTVIPAFAQKPVADIARFERVNVEFKGEVKSIVLDGGHRKLVVVSPTLDEIQVEINDSSTTVFSESTGGAATLAVGSYIEVDGVSRLVDGVPVVYATTVELEDSSDADLPEIEGKVVSKTGTTLVVSVEDANFRQTSKTISVDVTGAKYVRGSIDQIFVGSYVSLSGSVANGVMTVQRIDVAGGTSAKELEDGDVVTGAFDIEGVVTEFDGEDVAVAVEKVRGVSGAAFAAAGQTLPLAIGDAFFKTGMQSCLENATVRIKGTVSAEGAMAREVEVYGGCGLSVNEDGVRLENPEGDGTSVRAEGRVRALDVGSLTLTMDMYEASGFNPTSRTVTVALSDATTTNLDGSLLSLLVGDTIEVRGAYFNGRIAAERLERE